jgi:hypothetical protein
MDTNFDIEATINDAMDRFPTVRATLADNPIGSTDEAANSILRASIREEASASSALPAKKRGRPANVLAKPRRVSPGGKSLDGHSRRDPQTTNAVEKTNGSEESDLRFADPLVAEIRTNFKLMRRSERARLKLVLQAQALIRAETGCAEKEGPGIFKEIKTATEAAVLSFLRISVASKTEKAGARLEYGMDGIAAANELGRPLYLIDALVPLLAAMLPLEEQSKTYEKALTKLGKELPVFKWIHHFPGLSPYGLAKIVGEAGDLGAYKKGVSGLWSRLGLAPYAGKAVTKGRTGLTSEEWTALGYSPARRSTIWNIGGSIVGGMGRGPRPMVGEDWRSNPAYNRYQRLFIERIIYEAERDPETHGRPPTAEGKMSFSAHAANRAKRYVEKRVIKRLYVAWRAAQRSQK